MRLLLATILLASSAPAGAVPLDHTQELGELSVCYLPATRYDEHIRREPLLQLFGDLKTGDVLGARYTPAHRAPESFSARGLMVQAIDTRSHASGVNPRSHIESRFSLVYNSPASWVSFYGDLELLVSGELIRVECFDRDANPNVKPRTSEFFVVGIASVLVPAWSATSDMPEVVKPQTDLNAQAQCSGATRVSDYLVTYEGSPGSLNFTVLVSAHYRCGQVQ